MNGVWKDRNGNLTVRQPERPRIPCCRTRSVRWTTGQVKYQFVPAAEWSDHEEM